jgi:nucleotide-binding universal stress UspA family protein
MRAPRSRFQDVLCGVDFSQDSRAALQYAAAVARRGGGRVYALFVNDPLLEQAAAVALPNANLAETTERELQKFVAAALGPETSPIAAPVVASGDPAEEIRKTVKRLSADLIVLGTRGLGGAGKFFFGSTTSRVLRSTEYPILAVPAAGGKRRKGMANPWPTQVLAAIKMGEPAAADARAAADVAAWFGASLTLITVVEPVQSPLWLLGGGRVDDRGRLMAAKTRLSEIADKLDKPGIAVRALLGPTADQIGAAAVDTGGDLIILRLRADAGLLGARQGSVTYRVLSTARVPVLALSAPSRSK